MYLTIIHKKIVIVYIFIKILVENFHRKTSIFVVSGEFFL